MDYRIEGRKLKLFLVTRYPGCGWRYTFREEYRITQGSANVTETVYVTPAARLDCLEYRDVEIEPTSDNTEVVVSVYSSNPQATEYDLIFTFKNGEWITTVENVRPPIYHKIT